MPIGEDDLQAYIDGRLDADRLTVVEAYIAANPSERAKLDDMRADVSDLRNRLAAKADEPIPAHLRISAIRQRAAGKRQTAFRQAAAAVVLIGAGALGGWLIKPDLATRQPAPLLVASTATDAYRTFVVEVVHPVEVGADDEAHLIKWLSNRTGVELQPPDLSSFGYTLLGGRVLPGGSAAAAQLMYETPAGERLTVFLRPGATGQTGFTFEQEGEVSNFVWVDRGFDFAVTAKLDRAALLPIATAIYQDLI